MNSRTSPRGLLVAASVIGAGVIHLAAVRSHIGSPAAVASFTGVGIIQILLGASLLSPGALLLKRVAVLGIGGLSIAAWLVSRTWGLPAVSGHAGAEAVGAADLAAVVLQLISLLLVLIPVPTQRANPPARTTSALVVLPVVALSAIATLSLLAVPPHAHAHPPARSADARTSVAVPGARLVKRTVPMPSQPPAVPGHVDTPGTPPHSH